MRLCLLYEDTSLLKTFPILSKFKNPEEIYKLVLNITSKIGYIQWLLKQLYYKNIRLVHA